MAANLYGDRESYVDVPSGARLTFRQLKQKVLVCLNHGKEEWEVYECFLKRLRIEQRD